MSVSPPTPTEDLLAAKVRVRRIFRSFFAPLRMERNRCVYRGAVHFAVRCVTLRRSHALTSGMTTADVHIEVESCVCFSSPHSFSPGTPLTFKEMLPNRPR